MARGPAHRQVVGEHRALEAQFAAQDVADPAARQAGRQLIHFRKQHMRHHDGRQTVVDQAPVGHQVGIEIRQCTPIDRQRQVRIGDHRAMPGKMLGGGRHARVAHAVHVGDGKLADRSRLAVQRAIADHAREAVVEIDTGRKGKIESAGEQLGGHQPAVAPRQLEAGGRRQVELMSQVAHRRQHREAAAKALHPAAFVVDRHQQRRLAQGMDLAHQVRQLFGIGVVACEQDHTSDQGVRQHLAVLGAQRLTCNVDHQWPETHGVGTQRWVWRPVIGAS